MELDNQYIRDYYKSLYDELKEKCNPKHFVDPYDAEKVRISNQIYSQLENYTNSLPNLTHFRNIAVEKLGVHFSASKLYEYLSDKYDPKKFVGEHYDAEKLNIANEIYSKVQQNCDSVIELEKIAREYKILPGEDSGLDKNNQQTGNNDVMSSTEATVIIILLLCIILGIPSFLYFTSDKKSSAIVATESYDRTKTNSLNNSFHLEFAKYGFSIDTPCKFEDVSSKANGDFLLNYGGITDGNDQDKMAAYQLIVTRMPVGYKDLPRKQYESFVDKALRSQVQHFKTYKSIRFGYEEYPGYVCETMHKGYRQKAVIFAKENYIIALTLISNNELDSKFNKYTNGFKTMK